MERGASEYSAPVTSSAVGAQDQHQAQSQDRPSEHLLALGVRPVFIQAASCDGKLASVLFSSFKEAISTSQRHELIRDLSDNGKMDTVLIIQMACEEHKNSVSVKSAYGMAKCFGPKNCHAALDGRTGNVLSCDPNGESTCGKETVQRLRICVSHYRDQCEIGVNERRPMGVHFSPRALRQFPSRGPQTPQSRAGWPGFLFVELVRSILFRLPAQNVKISVSP